MFTYVMTQGTPKNILPDMVFVNIMVVGGYLILLRTRTKSAIMTVELDPL